MKDIAAQLVEAFRTVSIANADVNTTFDNVDRPYIYVDDVQLSLIGLRGQYKKSSGLTVTEVTYVGMDARPVTEQFDGSRMGFHFKTPAPTSDLVLA